MVFIYLPLYRNYGIPINLLCLGGGKRTCRCRPVLSRRSRLIKNPRAGVYCGGHPLPVAPRIIISPHAGYPYSGPIAGKGYAAIDPEVTTVIILGPPHYLPVRGIAAPSEAWFETPLGRVPVDRERIQKLLVNPIAFIDDRPHGPEHSIEVQIPFLQVRLSSFKIVPLIVSETDPEKAAEAIYPLIDDHTLVIASSDFSHYLTQEQARAEDDKSIASILAGNTGGMIDACGETPIRVAMALAKKMGLQPSLLDARTSYDTAPEYGPTGWSAMHRSFSFRKPPQNRGAFPRRP